MARLKENEFSASTKRIAAQRVGYLCSFPSCRKLTIGPNKEGSRKVSYTGKSCHIYAAAPGGKRFNPSLKAKEISSIDNCIHMCSEHGTRIDTDQVTFSVELLQKWKREAEDYANRVRDSKRLAGKAIKIIGSHFNAEQLKKHLQSIVIKGDFQSLSLIISALHSDENEAEIVNILDQYEIISLYYCDPQSLILKLKEYALVHADQNASLLIEFFVENLESQYLKEIFHLCNNADVKTLGQFILNNNFEGERIALFKSDEEIEFKVSNATLGEKFNTNLIFKQRLPIIENPIFHFVFYDKEWYYNLLKEIQEVRIESNLDFEFDAVEQSQHYRDLLKQVNKVKDLCPIKQISFWQTLLRASTLNSQEFYRIVGICPSLVLELDDIQSEIIGKKIMDNDLVDINFVELFLMCQRLNDYSVIFAYITRLSSENPIEAIALMDGNQSIFECHNGFLMVYLNLKKQSDKEFDRVSFLKNYENVYGDNPTFQCLIIQELDLKNEELKERLAIIKNSKAFMYPIAFQEFIVIINAFNYAGEYELIAGLYHNKLPRLFKQLIAEKLEVSGIDELIEKAKAIFADLGGSSDERKFNSLIGAANCASKLCGYNEARELFEKAFRLKQSKELAWTIFSLRSKTNCLQDEDEVLLYLQKSNDSHSQNNVACFYMEKHDLESAEKYFLRSMLIEENLPSLNGYMQCVVDNKGEIRTITKIEENTTATLKGVGDLIIRISIHPAEIMKGIENSNFAGSIHLTPIHTDATPLMFRKKGDSIAFQGTDYIITDIEPSDKTFFQYAIGKLDQANIIQTIRGNSPEEMIEEIKKLVINSENYVKEKIGFFNENKIMPVSMFTKKFGRENISAYHYLFFENDQKFYTNLNLPSLEETTFVLGIDALLALIWMNVDISKLKNDYVLYVPKSVENIIRKEVSGLAFVASREAEKGTMLAREGRVAFVKNDDDRRRATLNVCSRLQNLVASLKKADKAFDADIKEKSLLETFRKTDLAYEGDLIAFARSLDATIITDEFFVVSVANIEKVKNSGIHYLLSLFDLTVEEYLKVLENLAFMNYSNYLPLFTYDTISNQIAENKDRDKQQSDLIKLNDFLQGNVFQNAETILNYHKDIIIALMNSFSKTYPPEELIGDTFYRIVQTAAIRFMKEKYPDTYWHIHNNAMRKLVGINRQNNNDKELEPEINNEENTE